MVVDGLGWADGGQAPARGCFAGLLLLGCSHVAWREGSSMHQALRR